MPRKCICHGWMCSAKSLFGSIGGPASSTIVLSPCSVSSFAAHPPLIPDPTTIASNSRDCCSPPRELLAMAYARHRGGSVEPSGHHFIMKDVLHHPLAR